MSIEFSVENVQVAGGAVFDRERRVQSFRDVGCQTDICGMADGRPISDFGGASGSLPANMSGLLCGSVVADESHLHEMDDGEECAPSDKQLATTLVKPGRDYFNQCLGYLPGYRQLYYDGLRHNVYHCPVGAKEQELLEELARRAAGGTKFLLATEHITAAESRHYHVLHECAYGKSACRCAERGPMSCFRTYGLNRSRVKGLNNYIDKLHYERIKRVILYMAQGPGERQVLFLHNPTQLGQPPLPSPR